jgi:hypothetical protein
MTVHLDVTALAWPSTDVDAQTNHESAAGPANIFSCVYYARRINVDDSLTGAFAHRMMLQTGALLAPNAVRFVYRCGWVDSAEGQERGRAG